MTEPNSTERAEWDAWVASRPEPVRSIATRLPAWRTYRLVTTGQLVRIAAYSEDGTVRVDVIGHTQPHMAELVALLPVGVFGVQPDDLVTFAEGEQ